MAMERPFCHILYLELWTSIALLADADHRRANCIATSTAGQSLQHEQDHHARHTTRTTMDVQAHTNNLAELRSGLHVESSSSRRGCQKVCSEMLEFEPASRATSFTQTSLSHHAEEKDGVYPRYPCNISSLFSTAPACRKHMRLPTPGRFSKVGFL